MFEAFLLTITALLSIVGLSELVHWVCYMILRPKAKPQSILLTVLTEDEAENQVLAAIEELRWHGTHYADTLVAVTVNLSESKKIICKNRFLGHDIVFLDSIEALENILGENNVAADKGTFKWNS